MKVIGIFKALSDETRVRIINVLRKGPLCVCEIEAILQITQSNASRHLTKLTHANLVSSYKEAKYVYYKIDDLAVKESTFIKEILDKELEKEEKLVYDLRVLNEYKKAGLNCETVHKTKEIILKINEEK